MSAESLVQVAPDSTGKKIRNLQLDVVQADGTTATVQMQVVVLSDEDGKIIATSQVHGKGILPTIDEQVLEQLAAMNGTLTKLLDMLALEFEQSAEDFDGEN